VFVCWHSNFVLANVVTALHAIGGFYQPAPFEIISPIEISFQSEISAAALPGRVRPAQRT
jgi:hypothetical protein